uniref:WD repeat-containing protein 44 n=3 Tax=Heterosigma akashiwo TaxID=2829 RepID=A0A6V1PAV1_HETAK
MRYYTQVECRNRKGPLRNGRKVTGLAFAHLPPGGSNAAGGGGASPRGPTAAGGGGGGGGGAGSVGVGVGEGTGATGGGGHQLLVTTNDSRLRLYRVDDYLMACKYKGLANDSMQIKASFSEDNRYIICGSENGRVYIWATQRKGDKDGGSTGANPGRRDRNNAHESFMAAGGDPAIATVAQFVPARAVRHALRPADAAPFPEHDQEHVNAMVISADYNGTIRVYCRSKFKR